MGDEQDLLNGNIFVYSYFVLCRWEHDSHRINQIHLFNLLLRIMKYESYQFFCLIKLTIPEGEVVC